MRAHSSAVSASKSISFSIDKDHFRRIEVEPEVVVYHIYPTLADWVGRSVPDDVNPRSHEDHALSGSVPQCIESTIRDAPEDFYLANRGETILADDVAFDAKRGTVVISLSDCVGPSAMHGVADGGTTDAVIARVQSDVAAALGPKSKSFSDLPANSIPQMLKTARVHLEIIVGLSDRDRVARLVQGRNTSRQVKTWSMENFRKSFDWIKDILESDPQFAGKVGYEENAGKATTILEVLALLTLFHPMYNAPGKAPTVAYSSKGRLDKRFDDPEIVRGYKSLQPLLTSILRLHDHVYATFETVYQRMLDGKGRLGRRTKDGTQLFPEKRFELPFTGCVVDRMVPTGILYPLLASLRALIEFPAQQAFTGGARWKTDPIVFYDSFGDVIMETAISQLEVVRNNPQTMGKTKSVYTSLHDRARLIYIDSQTGK